MLSLALLILPNDFGINLHNLLIVVANFDILFLFPNREMEFLVLQSMVKC